jgi:hypothetical protein
MKRLLVASLVAAGAWLGAAFAQETPEMQVDFVRKLRAKGYHDLVEEYIQKLEKDQPQLVGQLALERARSLVAAARAKSPDQRSGSFNKARDIFQDFVKKNEGKPEAAQARLEMARLAAYHGQALLTKALRDFEEPKEQHEAARKAEALFVQAGEELDIVIKQLQDKEQIHAKFDRAINYLDQARTYIDTGKDVTLRQRSELSAQALKMFLALAGDENSEVGLLANAWLVKSYQEQQDPTAVQKHLKKVLGASGKSTIPAQRLARYFQIQGLKKEAKVKTPLEMAKLIETECEKWLKDYGPAGAKTWEGQGVRFELADAVVTEARIAYKDNLQAAGAQPLLNKALKIYSAVAEIDGDFSEEANRRSIGISVTKLEKVPIEDIRDFDNCYLKALSERFKAQQLSAQIEDAKKDADKKKLEAAKKQHLRDTARALRQTLNLADDSTPIHKVDEARYLLMSLYFATGDLYRAEIAGEALGRSRTPTKRSSQGVGAAFLALDTISSKDDSDANRQKTRDLADYVLSPDRQKFWANDPITSVAHHRLAIMYHKNKEIKQAIEHLQKLSGDFAGFIYSQGQLTFMALEAAKDKNGKWTDGERKGFREEARAAIKRVPATLPVDADANTATMYFYSQMEEAKFLYSDAADDLKAGKLADSAAKYKQMGRFVEHHFETFKKSTLKFEDKTRNDLTTLMTVLGKYSKLGVADVEYRLGNYEKVMSFDLVGPAVQALKAQAAKTKEGKIRVKDNVVAGDVLGLALRTYIQKGDLDSAKQVFDILDRLAGEDDGGALQADENSVNMMLRLVKDIEDHIDDLKKREKTKLADAVEKYSKFIDSIADSVLKKRAGPKEYMFLANAYASLQQPGKAAQLYEKVPTPKAVKDVDDELDRRAKAKKTPFSDDEIAKLKTKLVDEEFKKRPELKSPEYQEKAGLKDDEKEALKERLDALRGTVAEELIKERQYYWYLQIQYGKAVREGKDWEKAYGILNRVVNHPLAEYQILAEMEKLHALEDAIRFGPAIKGWQELMSRLRGRAEQDRDFKKLYFDAYYGHARCWYKYSQAPKTIKDGKEEQALTNAAKYIFNLENAKTKDGWDIIGDHFSELMDAEPKLKAAYQKLKKTAAAQAAPAGK